MLLEKGYLFKGHQRPFDVYFDGKNEIRICESCNILSINGKRQMGVMKPLNDFLFNQNTNAS